MWTYRLNSCRAKRLTTVVAVLLVLLTTSNSAFAETELVLNNPFAYVMVVSNVGELPANVQDAFRDCREGSVESVVNGVPCSDIIEDSEIWVTAPPLEGDSSATVVLRLEDDKLRSLLISGSNSPDRVIYVVGQVEVVNLSDLRDRASMVINVVNQSSCYEAGFDQTDSLDLQAENSSACDFATAGMRGWYKLPISPHVGVSVAYWQMWDDTFSHMNSMSTGASLKAVSDVQLSPN